MSFTINRALLSSRFEGYKLADVEPAVQLTVQSIPSGAHAWSGNERGSDSFQITADNLFTNHLAASKSRLCFIGADERTITAYSKTSRSFESLFSASFRLSSLAAADLQNGDELVFAASAESHHLLVIGNGVPRILDLNLKVPLGAVKILHASEQESDSTRIRLLLQQTCPIESFTETFGPVEPNGRHKAVFLFYFIELGCNGTDADAKFLGWSLTRPSYSRICNGRFLIGTSMRLVTELSTEPAMSTELNDTLILTPETELDEATTPTSILDADSFGSAAASHIEDESCDEEFKDARELNTTCLSALSESEPSRFDFLETSVTGSAAGFASSKQDALVAIDHGVDCALFKVSFSDSLPQSTHICTFPALNYIQSGKRNRKYTILTPRLAFIIDSQDSIYAYEHPASNEQRTARQYIWKVPSASGSVLGWAYDDSQDGDGCLYLIYSHVLLALAFRAG